MTLPKPKREKDRPYLDWIRTQTSITGKASYENGQVVSEPHHFTKRGRGGMGTKCPDSRAIPLTFDEHREIHQVGRFSFLRRHNLTEDDIETYILELNEIWGKSDAK